MQPFGDYQHIEFSHRLEYVWGWLQDTLPCCHHCSKPKNAHTQLLPNFLTLPFYMKKTVASIFFQCFHTLLHNLHFGTWILYSYKFIPLQCRISSEKWCWSHFFISNSSIRKLGRSDMCLTLAWSDGGIKVMYPEASIKCTIVYSFNSLERTALTCVALPV